MPVLTIIFYEEPIMMILPAGTLTVSGMPHRQSPEHDRPGFHRLDAKLSPRGRKPFPSDAFVNRRSKLFAAYGDSRHRGWRLQLGSFSMPPQRLSKQIAHLRRKPERRDEKSAFVTLILKL